MVRRGVDTNFLKTVDLLNGFIYDDVVATVDFLNKHFDNPNLYYIGWSERANYMLRATILASEKCPFNA